MYSIASTEDTVFSPNSDVFQVVEFGINTSVLIHSKAIYNVLIFLGDVGGLNDALKIIVATLYSIFGSSGRTSYIISKIFYARPLTAFS